MDAPIAFLSLCMSSLIVAGIVIVVVVVREEEKAKQGGGGGKGGGGGGGGGKGGDDGDKEDTEELQAVLDVEFQVVDAKAAPLPEDSARTEHPASSELGGPNQMRVIRLKTTGAIIGVLYYNTNEFGKPAEYEANLDKYVKMMQRIYLGYRDKKFFHEVHFNHMRLYAIPWANTPCGRAAYSQTFAVASTNNCNGTWIALHEFGHHFNGPRGHLRDPERRAAMEASFIQSLRKAPKEEWAPYGTYGQSGLPENEVDFTEYCAEMFGYWFNKELRAKLKKHDRETYNYFDSYFYKLEALEVDRPPV